MEQYNFKNLLGNTAVLQILRRTLELGTFSKFSIFSGTLGCGKSTSAKIAAMALTCSNPRNGQPCLECASCKANAKAFESTGVSMNVKVINIGNMITKTDVRDLIKEVFVLQNSGNTVYIFEEAHALKDIKGATVAFLEEIDRMPPNTYIIMCTTKEEDLLPELRSRATIFNFKRLGNVDSEALLRNTAERKYHLNVPDSIISILVSYSKGIPRTLLNSLDFVITNDVDLDELKEFIQVIDDSAIIDLFISMSNNSFFIVSKQLTENYEISVIVDALKSFLVRAVYLVEADINDNFSNTEKDSIKTLFNSQNLDKIIRIVEQLNRYSTLSDIMFALFKCRLILMQRTVVDVVKEKKRLAAESKAASDRLFNQNLKATSFNDVHLTRLGGGKV